MAIADAVSVVAGFASALLLAIGLVPGGGYLLDEHGVKHWSVLIRADWMLDWGIRLLVLSFAAQVFRIKETLERAFPKKRNK